MSRRWRRTAGINHARGGCAARRRRRGAEAGVLIRNAEALELFEKITTIVVDVPGDRHADEVAFWSGATGKDATGQITIGVSQEGNEVAVEELHLAHEGLQLLQQGAAS